LRIGVIRDVPTDIDDETAKKHLVSQSKIIEVNRLMLRSTRDGKTELLPSKSLCIKFAGQILPKSVSLFYTRHVVSAFIPKVRICYNCFRSGHISKTCRSKSRCMRCGETPHANPQDCGMLDVPPKCINCGGSHIPTSHDCPMVITQKKIIALAAQDNISLLAAKKKISPGPSSSPGQDVRFDFNRYPPLNNNSELASQHDDLNSGNRFAVFNSPVGSYAINEEHSYANAIKVNAIRAPPFSSQFFHPSKPTNSSPPNHSLPSPPRNHTWDARNESLIYPNGRPPTADVRNGVFFASQHPASSNSPSGCGDSDPSPLSSSSLPSPPFSAAASGNSNFDFSSLLQTLISFLIQLSSNPSILNDILRLFTRNSPPA
ncbi:hypothetical protein ALC62_00081, partial [Cyphomyrmex costatus]